MITHFVFRNITTPIRPDLPENLRNNNTINSRIRFIALFAIAPLTTTIDLSIAVINRLGYLLSGRKKDFCIVTLNRLGDLLLGREKKVYIEPDCPGYLPLGTRFNFVLSGGFSTVDFIDYCNNPTKTCERLVEIPVRSWFGAIRSTLPNVYPGPFRIIVANREFEETSGLLSKIATVYIRGFIHLLSTRDNVIIKHGVTRLVSIIAIPVNAIVRIVDVALGAIAFLFGTFTHILTTLNTPALPLHERHVIVANDNLTEIVSHSMIGDCPKGNLAGLNHILVATAVLGLSCLGVIIKDTLEHIETAIYLTTETGVDTTIYVTAQVTTQTGEL